MWTQLESHLGSRQVARVLYGSIIGLALVVALEKHPPGPGVMAVWLLGTGLAVALAEVFSDVVGTETSTRHPVTRAQVRHIAEDAAAVAVGVASPAVFFVLAALGVLEVGTAFTVAKWSGLGLIGGYGYWAARFAGEPPGRALVKGACVALVGAGLIALKALVH
ncbi:MULTISPECIES: hypothetical protein [unclassified Blastococcus]